MNEITIHGNLTAEPVLRHGQTGRAFVAFTVAVNRTYYSQDAGRRVEMPAIYHRVVAFNALAENAAATLRQGTCVTVTGYFSDDSYTPEGATDRVRRQRLEAYDIAVSLRFATATVAKRTPTPRSTAPAAAQEPAA